MSAAFDLIWGEYQGVVSSVAGRHGARSRRWGAEREDFEQEMAAWIFQNADRLVERHYDDGPVRFGKYLARCLDNQCRDYARGVTAQVVGPRTDQYFYSVPELKVLLDYMFDPESKFNPPQVNGEERAKRDPAHGNNWLVTLADVESGYNKLTLEDQNLLALFHRDGYRNKDLAEEWSLTEAQMSWRHTRAVERLLDHLGGPKPEPSKEGDPFRGRRAMTNAAARALTSAQYEED